MDAYERTHPTLSTTFRFNDPDRERPFSSQRHGVLGPLRWFRDHRRNAA